MTLNECVAARKADLITCLQENLRIFSAPAALSNTERDTLLDIAHVRAEVPAVAAVLRGFADGFTTGERLAEKMRQRGPYRIWQGLPC